MKHLQTNPLSARLVMWLRVRFTRSHKYYRLVKKKTVVYAGRTHQKFSCAAGFVEAAFCCFSWGRNHWTVELCSTVVLFIKVNSFFSISFEKPVWVNFNSLALFTWIIFFFEKPVPLIDFTRTVHVNSNFVFVFLKN